MKREKKILFFSVLLAVLFAGALLRTAFLDDTSLWLDEGITYYNSSAEDYNGVWDRVARLDQSPPGYYMVTHTYLELFGPNEFGLRFISVIFGVLTILFLYLFVSEVFNIEMALFAAVLLAFNSFHIGFSMEARMYSLLALEAIIGFYLLFKAIQTDDKDYLWWGLLSLICIAGIYTHYFYFFVMLGYFFTFLILLSTVKKNLGKFLMGLLTTMVVFFAYIPWFPNLIKQLQVDRYWMAPTSLSDIRFYFMDFAGGSPYLLWIFMILTFVGIYWRFTSKRPITFMKRRIYLFCIIVFLIAGIIIPLVYSTSFEPILKIRYIVYAIPFWLTLVAMGLYTFRRFNFVLSIIILASICYLSFPWKASAYPIEFGEDFRGLTEIVNMDSHPVVVHTPSIAHVINFYNLGVFEVKPFPFSDDLTEYNVDEGDKFKFTDLVKDFSSYYLVVSHTHENPPGLLKVWSGEICTESTEIEVSGMEVILFKGCNY